MITRRFKKCKTKNEINELSRELHQYIFGLINKEMKELKPSEWDKFNWKS